MRSLKFLISAVLVFFMAANTYSQERFSAEFRPGISFPLNEMAGTKVNTGYGFELTLAYEVLPDVGIYAGWGWNKFNADNAFMTTRVDIEETGYTAGIQYIHRLYESSFSYLIRGGVVYNHLELEDNDGELIADSGQGIGWQAEAGISFDIGNSWEVRPTLRYRSLPGNIDVFNGQMSVDLRYISFGVGLAKKF